jgi:hypothetical protein
MDLTWFTTFVDVLKLSFLEKYLEHTSSMFISLIFVLLTIIFLYVLDYLSRQKLKEVEAAEQNRKDTKTMKKKTQKKKKIDRDEEEQEQREKAEREEKEQLRQAQQIIQATADRYNAFKDAWKNSDVYLGAFHIYAHAQRKDTVITACTLVRGAHVTYLPDVQFINFMDLDRDKRLTLVDFVKFREAFGVTQVPRKDLMDTDLVFFDCSGMDFDEIFEKCKPARL